MSYSDGEEGWDGLADLPHDVSSAGPSSLGSRNVKRRTSKGMLLSCLFYLKFHTAPQLAINVGNPNANVNVQILMNLAGIA